MYSKSPSQQTWRRLSRGRAQRVRRESVGFSRWNAHVLSADDDRAVQMSLAERFGARREDGLGREGNKDRS